MMDISDIAFPNLDIYLNGVPKAINVFGFDITFYGIIIAFGFFLGIAVAAAEANRLGLKKDCWWDASVWLIFFSIVGARAYYVLFSWDMYKNDPMSIFNLRNGGLAIYGGVIAGFITIIIFTKINKIPTAAMIDCGMFGLLLGQVMGRWGNFFNREVFGNYTDNFFAMRLPIEAVRERDITAELAAHIEPGANYIQVHPTFLYESAGNLLLLLLLLLYRKKKKFDGEIICCYFIGYGALRFFLEGIRTDRLMLLDTDIAVSQLLSGIMVVIAIMMLMIMHIRAYKGEAVLTVPGENNSSSKEDEKKSKKDDDIEIMEITE